MAADAPSGKIVHLTLELSDGQLKALHPISSPDATGAIEVDGVIEGKEFKVRQLKVRIREAKNIPRGSFSADIVRSA